MTSPNPLEDPTPMSPVESKQTEWRLHVERHLAVAMGEGALDRFREFAQGADKVDVKQAYEHLAGLMSAMTGQKIETEPSYEPDPLLPRLHQFINILCQYDIAEELELKAGSREDMSGVVNAIIEMNGKLDPRTDVNDMAQVLGLAYQGLTDREIATIRNTNRTAVSQRLSKIRERTERIVAESRLDPLSIVVRNVEGARQGKTRIWYDTQIPTIHKNDVTAQRSLYPKQQVPGGNRKLATLDGGERTQQSTSDVHEIIQKNEQKNGPSPSLMPEKITETVAIKKLPSFEDDEDCPNFYRELLQYETLDLLYGSFPEDSNGSLSARIIQDRAEGRDNTRKPDPAVSIALNQLDRMSLRGSADFGNDERQKLAFKAFIGKQSSQLNTLGDVYRALVEMYPELDERGAAEILAAAIDHVLREYQKVLVVKK